MCFFFPTEQDNKNFHNIIATYVNPACVYSYRYVSVCRWTCVWAGTSLSFLLTLLLPEELLELELLEEELLEEELLEEELLELEELLALDDEE